MGDPLEEDITSYVLDGSTANMSEEAQDLESHLSGQPADDVSGEHEDSAEPEEVVDEEEEHDDDESEGQTPEQRAARMMEEKLRRYDIAKSMIHLSTKK
jgi:hypothetical protein